MKIITYKKLLFLIAYTVVLFTFALNLEYILLFLGNFLNTISPFFIAICIAFVVNLPLKNIEPHLSKKLKPSTRRNLAIFLSFLSIFLFFTTITIFLVPQISQSTKNLGTTFPSYFENIQKSILNLAEKYKLSSDITREISSSFQQISEFFSSFIFDLIPKIFSYTLGIANNTINFFIGFVISFYLLSSKENLILGLKRLIRATFPKKACEYLFYVGKLSNKMFEAFISGQLLEAFILGSLCTIGMLILQLEYAILIGVIIGISSLIPIFGAILGTIPCLFILFVINPKQAFIFLAFIFILQQLEGDFIYPRVVGKSIGISGLWVMFAMICGGSMFGVFGLIIGIPIFAVMHTLILEWVELRLDIDKKNQH